MSSPLTTADVLMLSALGVTAGNFDFAVSTVLSPEHFAELSPLFTITAEPLMPTKIADLILLQARPSVVGRSWTPYQIAVDQAIVLHYGYDEWRDGDRCLFSSVRTEDGLRRFGIGTVGTVIDANGYETRVLRSTAGHEFAMFDALSCVHYGRVIGDAQTADLFLMPSLEAVRTAEPGDVIEIDHGGGVRERREVVRVTTGGTVYAKKPGQKSARSFTVDYMRRTGLRISIVSRAAESKVTP